MVTSWYFHERQKSSMCLICLLQDIFRKNDQIFGRNLLENFTFSIREIEIKIFKYKSMVNSEKNFMVSIKYALTTFFYPLQVCNSEFYLEILIFHYANKPSVASPVHIHEEQDFEIFCHKKVESLLTLSSFRVNSLVKISEF